MSAILIVTERDHVRTVRIPHLLSAPILTRVRSYFGAHDTLEVELAGALLGSSCDEHPADIGTPIYDALAWKYDATPAWDAS
jgi:hypothetical protein